MQSFIIRFMMVLGLAMTSGAGAGTFVTPINADTTPPVLTTPAVQSITGGSAVITWSSDEVADSRVYFGEATPLVKVAGEIEYATAHSVKLTKLLPSTTYSYQVVSADPLSNKTTSSIYSFTTIAKIDQTISFGAAPAIVVNGTGTVSATGGASGNAITYTSTTTGICTVSGSTVTAVTAGACTIAANQAGDANYNAAAQVTQNISVAAIVSSAPTIGTATAGNVQATVSFAAPVNNGGSAITGYTVISNPSGGVDSNAGSVSLTHTITGLTNGTAYTFTVTATNSAGTSLPSAASNSVTPVAPAATTFTVSTSAGANGSISPAATIVTQGNTTSFTITPDTGYTTSSASGCGGSLIGSTYTTGSITADCTVSATFTQVTTFTQATLVTGWNLLGNSINAPLDVTTAFGDTTKVTSVWKWTQATSKWAFYAPSLSAPDLATYAAGKGYDVLATVNGGEGFWVNAKTAFTVQLPTGSLITTSYFQQQLDPTLNKLVTGWNLIATGDNVTPSDFNKGLSVTPPAPGTIPLNVTTLWTWDSALSSWYFYAPSLEANGGLANYITTKGYLNFGTKTLDPAMGFWVNKP